ncbi:cohesin domain-containing protein [Ruminococcus sp. HUN007]|uniref:cohesin domain-containing protein n=1 Tax=Ruminococcus sp. HUN007 TaxID=1514668 RepID=UPI0005D1D88D|nr:cohesin domain-containing protein [Ruminococcus sp. HUN007]
MSRKFRRTVASTLALAMMAGTVGVMPELQFSSVVQAADAGATVSVNLTDASKTTFKPGDTFSVTCDVTDNADGFSALNAYVTYNKKALSLEKWEYATTDEDDQIHQNINDPTKSNTKYQNPDANLSTLVQLYVDQSATNLTGDQKLSKLTFKVLDGASGDYKIEIGGDPVLQNGKKVADQNRIVEANGEKTPLELAPNYKSLTIKVGSEAASPAPTAEVTKATSTPEVTKATSTPEVTKATSTPAVTTATDKPTTAPTATPAADAIIIEAGEISGNAGDKVKIPVTAKNVGSGFSALQFDYDIEGNMKIGRGLKGDFGCSWTIGKTEKSAQFLENEGMNITGDGVIGRLEIEIPAGTKDGVYEVKFSNIEGSTVDKTTGKQVKIESGKFAAVTGKIIVGDVPTVEPTVSATAAVTEPTTIPTSVTPTKAPELKEQEVSKSEIAGGLKGPKVDAGVYKVSKAGETVKIKIKVTDNNDGGFNALNAWLDVDTNIFEIDEKAFEAGDVDDPENEDSVAYNKTTTNVFKKKDAAENIETVLALFSDTENLEGDTVIATIPLKVKAGVKDGFYSLPFDAKGDGGAMSNRITENGGDRKPVVLNPTFLGAIVQVGEVEPAVTTPAVTKAEPAETTPAETKAEPAKTTPAETKAEPAKTTPAETKAEPAKTTPAETKAEPAETTPAVTKADPTAAPTAKSDAIQIQVGEASGKPGEKIKVEISAKNIGAGFSALQFDYELDDQFKVSRGIKGDFGCSWTVGKKSKSLQFLEADGMNITKDGVIGKIEIEIPADAKDGEYEFKLSNFEGSQVDKATNKQNILKGENFEGIAGKIIVNKGTPAPETTPAETKAEPAETTPAETKAEPAKTTPAETKAEPAETTPAETKAEPAETTPAETKAEPTTPPTVKPTDPTEAAVGDVDDNGVVNTRDLIALKRYLLLADKTAPVNGDVNGDKVINSLDLIRLVKILLK